MPRRYPTRNRRAPMRLLIELDEDDTITRYEERRIVVTHEMVNEGEAEEDGDGYVSDPDEPDESVECDDIGNFVVGDADSNSDEEYLPSDGELRSAELEEELDEESISEEDNDE